MLAAALAFLAFQPAAWLVRSWFEDGYASDGEWVFTLAAGAAAWSLSSPAVRVPPRDRDVALGLFLATALIRLASAVLAIHALGALALVADVYALALSLGLRHRVRSISPGGLAALFAFALPIERLLQRGLGFPLQALAVCLARPILVALEPGLRIDGVSIRAPGAELSIDLPCSGARGLVLLSTLALALVAIRRVRGAKAIAELLGLAVGAALAANTIRIAILVEAVLRPPFGIDAMAEPWHGLAGLVPLAIAAALLLLRGRARRSPDSKPPAPSSISGAERAPLECQDVQNGPNGGRRSAWVGPILFALAALVHRAPERPLDVSRATAPLVLPEHIGAYFGRALPLSDQERAYFTEFGGAAAKSAYADLSRPGGDPRTVIAVRTTAPLRHLHPADECLIGRGHRVEHLGVLRGPLAPSTVYASIAPTGERYRVEVSYFSETGEVAASVAEVAWRWMKAPHAAWTMIERITPEATCGRDPASCRNFLESIARALEVAPKENRL
jgi:exosortase/archaeosortase family protein